jgi:hypothetical protein
MESALAETSNGRFVSRIALNGRGLTARGSDKDHEKGLDTHLHTGICLLNGFLEIGKVLFGKVEEVKVLRAFMRVCQSRCAPSS